MAWDKDSKIKDIIACPEALAIVERHIPGVMKNPGIGLIKGKPISMVQKMAPDKLKMDVFEKILKDWDNELNNK